MTTRGAVRGRDTDQAVSNVTRGSGGERAHDEVIARRVLPFVVDAREHAGVAERTALRLDAVTVQAADGECRTSGTLMAIIALGPTGSAPVNAARHFFTSRGVQAPVEVVGCMVIPTVL